MFKSVLFTGFATGLQEEKMPTISHIVAKIVDDRPLLQEAMIEDIVSFGALAEKIMADVERELGKKAKVSAVVMALRRHADKVRAMHRKLTETKLKGDIIMKTNLCDMGIIKSNTLFDKLKKIYSLVDYEKGETLNIIHGNYEVSIVTNERHMKKIKDILEGEKIARQEKGLVMLGINFSKEYIEQPGIIAAITRKLSWNGINLIEIISTFKELNYVVSSKDAMKGYKALQEMIIS